MKLLMATLSWVVSRWRRTVPQETVRLVPPAGEDTDSPASAVSIETGVVGLQHADDSKRPGLYEEDVDSCTTGGELVVP